MRHAGSFGAEQRVSLSYLSECAALEFRQTGLPFVREAHLPVYYLGTQIGARRVDFLVADKMLVELKAVVILGPDTFAQIINYLKAYNLEVGLLLNFGQASLVYRRFLRTSPNPGAQTRPDSTARQEQIIREIEELRLNP